MSRAGSLLDLVASCEVGNVDDAADDLVAAATMGFGGYVCLCNVHLVVSALHDGALAGALAGAWKRLPDGAPVAWLQRRLGHTEANRIGGPDLLPRVVERGLDVGLRHFFLGSTEEVLQRLRASLVARYPGVLIVGTHAPEYAREPRLREEDIHALREAEPHVVWCAFGAPKQELFMRWLAPRLPGVILAGVGAAFDFVAGSKTRAPRWMQRAGLEWLHRLMTEPARLGGRYARTNSEFVVRCGYELARQRRAA